MNTAKTLLAVSVLAATASAQAAVYNVSGTLTAWNTAPAVTTYTTPANFTGTVDDATGAYAFSFSTFTAHVDLYSGAYTANVTTIGQALSGTGNSAVTRTVTGGSCSGAKLICNSIPTAPIAGTLAFSVAGGVLTGTLDTSQASGGPTPSLSTYSFSGPAAVPVPAAAWLFGSGLLGLAGTARRRRSV